MQSIRFTRTIVSDYKAGINHFYLQRIWHPMQIYARNSCQRFSSSNMLWFHRWHTVRPICRPRVNQRIVYNGHKRLHAITFQSMCIPNGLIANLSGPWGELAFF